MVPSKSCSVLWSTFLLQLPYSRFVACIIELYILLFTLAPLYCRNIEEYVDINVIMAITDKLLCWRVVFWDITSRRPVKVNGLFGEIICLHHRGRRSQTKKPARSRQQVSCLLLVWFVFQPWRLGSTIFRNVSRIYSTSLHYIPGNIFLHSRRR